MYLKALIYMCMCVYTLYISKTYQVIRLSLLPLVGLDCGMTEQNTTLSLWHLFDEAAGIAEGKDRSWTGTIDGFPSVLK